MAGDGGSEAVSSYAPAGAEQEGIIDWFRNLFKKKEEPVISGPYDVRKNRDADSRQYVSAMKKAINSNTDEAKVKRNNRFKNRSLEQGKFNLDSLRGQFDAGGYF